MLVILYNSLGTLHFYTTAPIGRKYMCQKTHSKMKVIESFLHNFVFLIRIYILVFKINIFIRDSFVDKHAIKTRKFI